MLARGMVGSHHNYYHILVHSGLGFYSVTRPYLTSASANKVHLSALVLKLCKTLPFLTQRAAHLY